MNRIRYTSKLVILSVALALASLSFAGLAAHPAHAGSSPNIYAVGEGGGAGVFGCCFTPNATLRVELLDWGLDHVVATQTVLADSSGKLGTLIHTNYVGPVRAAVDQVPPYPYLGTAWTTAYVFPSPHIDFFRGSPFYCGSVSIVESGFTPGATVQVELLPLDQSYTIDIQTVPVQSGWINDGHIEGRLNLYGYSGKVWVRTYQQANSLLTTLGPGDGSSSPVC